MAELKRLARALFDVREAWFVCTSDLHPEIRVGMRHEFTEPILDGVPSPKCQITKHPFVSGGGGAIPEHRMRPVTHAEYEEALSDD